MNLSVIINILLVISNIFLILLIIYFRLIKQKPINEIVEENSLPKQENKKDKNIID